MQGGGKYAEWREVYRVEGSMQSEGKYAEWGEVCRRVGERGLSIKLTLAVPVKSAGGFQDNFTEVLPSLPL